MEHRQTFPAKATQSLRDGLLEHKDGNAAQVFDENGALLHTLVYASDNGNEFKGEFTDAARQAISNSVSATATASLRQLRVVSSHAMVGLRVLASTEAARLVGSCAAEAARFVVDRVHGALEGLQEDEQARAAMWAFIDQTAAAGGHDQRSWHTLSWYERQLIGVQQQVQLQPVYRNL